MIFSLASQSSPPQRASRCFGYGLHVFGISLHVFACALRNFAQQVYTVVVIAKRNEGGQLQLGGIGPRASWKVIDGFSSDALERIDISTHLNVYAA